MTDQDIYASLKAHLEDLEEKSGRWHTHTCSSFLNEEELAAMHRYFPESEHIVYDGGYADARKKKIIFRYDADDDFSDVVCLAAKIDQRFRKIGHRDILGALMHLQIDRHSFGDFWVEDDHIYLYTSSEMAEFLMANLIRINQLSVSFSLLDDHPVQKFQMKEITVVAASERADAIVASLAHVSRAKAKEMIRQGLVQLNHVTLEHPDEVCNNNVTISIRGVGRFVFTGTERTTRNGRIAAVFQQYI